MRRYEESITDREERRFVARGHVVTRRTSPSAGHFLTRGEFKDQFVKAAPLQSGMLPVANRRVRNFSSSVWETENSPVPRRRERKTLRLSRRGSGSCGRDWNSVAQCHGRISIAGTNGRAGFRKESSVLELLG